MTVLWLAIGSAPALAFPAEQTMVPVAVGAAFALPALAALTYYVLTRIVALIGKATSLVVVTLAAVWLFETLKPGTTREVLELVGLKWGT